MRSHETELDVFASWLRARGARPATIQGRCEVLRSVLTIWPASPSADDVTAWLGQDHLSTWSRITYLSHARSWFRWQVETGRRDDDPTATLKAPRAPSGAPRPLTDGEVSRALLAADARMSLWLSLGLLAGLRAHEVAKVRREDRTPSRMHVLGKGGREDWLPMHPDLWAAIEPMGCGWLFPSRGTHIQGKAVSVAVSRHFRSLGIDGSMHRMRHTYGTRLLRNGTNIRVVQRLMRHASLEVTARYLLVDDDEAMSAIRGLAA